MKVINSKLAAIGLAAFVFASCSDSTSDGPVTPTTPDVTTIGLTQSDAAALAASVVNYKTSTANARKFFGTRASAEDFITSMPTFPTAPKLIGELNGDLSELVASGNSQSKNVYVIKNQNKLTIGKLQGVTIYVNGDCKLTYNETLGGNTIILAKGANLEFTGNGSMLKSTDTVYKEQAATFKSDNNQDLIIEGKLYASWDGQGETEQLYGGFGKTESKVNPTQNITFKAGSKAYIVGSIRAKNLTIEDGAVVTATRNIMNATKVDLAGALKVNGFCKTGTLNITGLLDASDANAAVKVTGQLNLENGSVIKANYVNVTNNEYDTNKTVTKVGEAELNLKSGGQIQIADLGVINVNNLNTDNASAGQIALQGNDAVAVVKADKFTNNGDERINTFSTSGTNSILLLQLTKCFAGTTEMPSSGDLDISASYLDYDKATTGALVQFKDEDNKQYGYELSAEAKKAKQTPKLDLVSSFGTNNGMSASCIQTVGNYVYVSYHTQGNGSTNMGGGLEVLHMNDNQLTADQEVNKIEYFDINHVAVDNNNVYVAASDASKGALLGVIPLNGNLLTTGDNAMKQYVLDAINEKNGIDANCVVKYGDNIVMSSTRGYEFYDKNFTHTFFEREFDVKGLTVANNQLYGLVTKADNTIGRIETFNNVNLAKATKQFYTKLTNIGPVDSKNTIAVDGTDVYVCLGENGLARYDADGNKVWEYKVPTIQNEKSEKIGAVKGNCNGVVVSGNYVYVAAGGYGLVVVGKATGDEICHRTAFNGKLENGQWKNPNSANYVTIGQDGNIYVAYGKSRVQVFKLTQTVK